jgi:hypothetical protein
MSDFSADWLALREPLDARSRSATLVQRLRAHAPAGERRIVDLATGSGANLRYLAPRLGGEQDWLLVDNDPALLEAMGARLHSWSPGAGLTLRERGDCLELRGAHLACRAHRVELDLARNPQDLDLEGFWLVTASALLDLVSPHWLDNLLSRCRRAGARLLFALTYDGAARFRPSLDDDRMVIALFHRHQNGDKGFGPALGPGAAVDASPRFQRHGYRVAEELTPWRLGPAHGALQSALVEGLAQAATAVSPAQAGRIANWERQRHTYLAAGTSRMSIGHRDVLGWPVDERS